MKYYWTQENFLWVARQIRYRDQLAKESEHPHDIMAYAQTTQQMIEVQRLLGGADNFENPVDASTAA